MLSLTLLVIPVGAQDAPPSPAELQFTFAVRLMQQRESDLAADAFADFLRDYPGDARIGDAHYYLALLKRQNGDAAGAMAELKQVAKPLYVTIGDATVLRGQLLLESGDAKVALAVLEPLNDAQFGKQPSAQSLAAWHYLLGAAYRAAGNTDAAAKQFELAATTDDSQVQGLARMELAKTQIERKQWDKALATLQQVVGSPEDQNADAPPQAVKLAAVAAEQLGAWKSAAGYYQRLVQHSQSSPLFDDAAGGYLRSLFNAGDDAQVLTHADELAKLVTTPDAKAGIDYWRAAALVRQKKYADAAKVCEPYLNNRQAGNDLRYLNAVATFHIDTKNFRGWYDTTDVSALSQPQRDHLLYLRAEAEPDATRATGLLGSLIEQKDSAYARPALLLRAKLYEQMGDKDHAAADYQRYARQYPADDQAAQAAAYAIDLALAGGQYDKVVAMIQAMDKPPAAVKLQLAVALIKLGRNAEAGKTLDDILAPADVDAQSRALAMYYRGLLLVPPEVNNADDIAPAVKMFQQAMGGDLPADQRVESLAVTARLQRMAGQTDEALKTYQQLRSVDPKGRFDGATALWVARGLLDGGDPKAATPWFEAAAASNGVKKDDPLWAAAMFGLAQSQQQQGLWDQAVEHYRMLLGYTGSYGERGRLGLAQSLAGAGHFDQAMEEYTGLLSAQASEVAAAALVDSALLEAAAADRSDRAGDASAAQSHRTEARRRLSRVVILYNLPELDPLPQRAMVLLGRLEETDGQTDRARGHYQSAAKERGSTSAKPQAAEMWRLIAQAELKRLDGQVGDAVFLFTKAAKNEGADNAGTYARQRLAALGEKP